MTILVMLSAFILVSWLVRRYTSKTWAKSMLWTVAGLVAVFLLAAVGVALVDFLGIADTIK